MQTRIRELNNIIHTILTTIIICRVPYAATYDEFDYNDIGLPMNIDRTGPLWNELITVGISIMRMADIHSNGMQVRVNTEQDVAFIYNTLRDYFILTETLNDYSVHDIVKLEPEKHEKLYQFANDIYNINKVTLSKQIEDERSKILSIGIDLLPSRFDKKYNNNIESYDIKLPKINNVDILSDLEILPD